MRPFLERIRPRLLDEKSRANNQTSIGLYGLWSLSVNEDIESCHPGASFYRLCDSLPAIID